MKSLPLPQLILAPKIREDSNTIGVSNLLLNTQHVSSQGEMILNEENDHPFEKCLRSARKTSKSSRGDVIFVRKDLFPREFWEWEDDTDQICQDLENLNLDIELSQRNSISSSQGSQGTSHSETSIEFTCEVDHQTESEPSTPRSQKSDSSPDALSPRSGNSDELELMLAEIVGSPTNSPRKRLSPRENLINDDYSYFAEFGESQIQSIHWKLPTASIRELPKLTKQAPAKKAPLPIVIPEKNNTVESLRNIPLHDVEETIQIEKEEVVKELPPVIRSDEKPNFMRSRNKRKKITTLEPEPKKLRVEEPPMLEQNLSENSDQELQIELPSPSRKENVSQDIKPSKKTNYVDIKILTNDMWNQVKKVT